MMTPLENIIKEGLCIAVCLLFCEFVPGKAVLWVALPLIGISTVYILIKKHHGSHRKDG